MWFWPRSNKQEDGRRAAATTGASSLTREVAGVASELGGALGLWTGAAPQRDQLLGGGGYGTGGAGVHGPGVPAPDSAYQYPYGLFEEAVDKDAHLSALIGQRKAAVLAWDRELSPCDGSPEAQVVCTLVRAGLEHIESAGSGQQAAGSGNREGRGSSLSAAGCQLLAGSLDRDLWELLDALPFGIAISEVVWEWIEIDGTGRQQTADSGRQTAAEGSASSLPAASRKLPALTSGRYLLPKALLSRHPRRFVFSPEGELRLLTAAEPVYGEPVPARKFIVFAPYGRHENPYGSPLVARVWWLAWFKRQVLKYWVLHCEKYGMPAVVLTHPPAATERERASYRRLIGSIQQETGLVVPEGVGLSLLEASRSGGPAAYQALLEFCNSEMSKAVVGQTLTVDTPAAGTGTYAMARVHQQVREDLTRMDAQALMGVVNSTLVRWICELNQVQGSRFKVQVEEGGSAASAPLNLETSHLNLAPVWTLRPPQEHDLRLQLEIDRFLVEHGVGVDEAELLARYGRNGSGFHH